MVKQVIVMRKDLKMRTGKIAAQSAHASLKVFFDRMDWYVNYLDQEDESFDIEEVEDELKNSYVCRMTPEMEAWKESGFTKICVYVDSEVELHEIYTAAIAADIPSALITDSGKTEFNGVPTVTCCAIGPDTIEKINEITGKLPLY